MIELMTVIAIIMVLAGLGVLSFNYVQNKQKRETARLQIQQIDTALTEYQLDSGVFPNGDGSDASTTEVYRVLSGDLNMSGQPAPNAKVYIPNMNRGSRGYNIENNRIMDPFGNAYRYLQPGIRNPEFDLWSFGVDGQENTDDDITNW